jgi:hypothetical protein
MGLHLHMATKTKNAHKWMEVPCIINLVRPLHVSATVVAIIRDLHYDGLIYRYIYNESLRKNYRM